MAGRRPKNPELKFSIPVRAMVTPPVCDALKMAQDKLGVGEPENGEIASDTVRLGMWLLLQNLGLMTPDLENDVAWESLYRNAYRFQFSLFKDVKDATVPVVQNKPE